MGKVGAGARRKECYLSVYLRVPPAPIVRRSEPLAGRVATRSGCPLFWCQEGAKRARGVGGRKGTGQAGSPPRMGAGEAGRACFGAPGPHREGAALDKALLWRSFILSAAFSKSARGFRDGRGSTPEVLTDPSLLPPHSHPSL